LKSIRLELGQQHCGMTSSNHGISVLKYMFNNEIILLRCASNNGSFFAFFMSESAERIVTIFILELGAGV
jgi:hypothetical protein